MSKYHGHENPFNVYMTPLDDNEPRGEWVSFPTTADAMAELFKRLNIGPTQWAIANVESHVYGIRGVIRECADLDELNHLACKLEDLNEEEFQQYLAVLETGERKDSMSDLINLCDNLDCYDFYPDVSDDEELGRHYLFEESYLHRATLTELEDYIDFDVYGQDIRENMGGKFAENCYVAPNGISFVEYYTAAVEDIPEEHLVTTKIEVPLLSDDERLDRSIELAITLDSFFREVSPDYANEYPDVHRQQEALCDALFACKLADIEKRLDALGQTEEDLLPMELEQFKAAIQYDPEQDVHTEVEKLRVLVVEPRKAPYIKEIAAGLETLQQEVGGPIAATYPFEDKVALICNDEGRLMGLELNRALYDDGGRIYDIVSGTFLITGLGEEDFASLDDVLVEKFSRRFQNIEIFAKIGDRTVMFQVPQDHISGSEKERVSIRDKLSEAKNKCILQPRAPTEKERPGPER